MVRHCSLRGEGASYSVLIWGLFSVVRQKTKEIIAFVQDEDALRDARKQAKQARDKFVGISADESRSYSKADSTWTHTHTHTHTCTQTHIHTNTLHKHTSGHLVADLVMFSLFSHTHTHTHTHMHTQVIVMTQSLVVVVATLHRPHLFPTRNPLQCRPMRRRRTQYRTKTWYQLKKRMRLLGRCIC